MNLEERKEMFKAIFSPKQGEKVLILVDTPHDNISDSDVWTERREKMAQEWYKTFSSLGLGLDVHLMEYKATGQNSAPIPEEAASRARASNLVVALTQFSASGPLFDICKAENSITRCASMPGILRSMEEVIIKTDYRQVRRDVWALKKMLDGSVGAEIQFSTKQSLYNLYIDLRNRAADPDDGDCTKTKQAINLPSGEACIAPYEAVGDERATFGDSKTAGVLPLYYPEGIVQCLISQNRITGVIGNRDRSRELSDFFRENESRRNIAELGIGCNQAAYVCDNTLLAEKVPGPHFAYGKSSHLEGYVEINGKMVCLRGKVESDRHIDRVYTAGCPIVASVVLLDNTGRRTGIVRDGLLMRELLEQVA